MLAVVAREPEGTYGYKIPQEVRQVIELSESTLYPVLRRLQKDECLEVYDRECSGRTRRYYKVTSRGWAQLHLYESEWRSYSGKITGLFEGRPVLTMRDRRMNRMLLRHWGILRRWRRILKKIFCGTGTERTATREQEPTAGQ